MKAKDRSQQQLIKEVTQLRQRIAELERSNAELKGAEEALRNSDERLKTVLENVNGVIFQLSPRGIIEYVSPRVKELYGYKPEELVGKHLKKTTPMREVPKAFEVLKYALSGKKVKNFEIDQVKRNGKIVHMEINGMPVKKNGTVIAVQGVMRDITERKRAEEKLQKVHQELEKRVEERTAELSKTNVLLRQEITERKQAEEALRESAEELGAIFNDVRDGIVLLDMTGKIIEINKRITETTGYTDKDIVGKRFKFLKMFTANSMIKMITAFAKTVAGQQSPPYEVEGYIKTGEKRIAEIHSSQLKKRGKTVGAVAVIRDITERKRAEVALRGTLAELTVIHQNVPIAMMLVDRDRRVRKVNEAAALFAGRPEEEMLGLSGGEALRCLHHLDDPRGCGFGPACATCTVRLAVLDTFATRESKRDVEAWMLFPRGDSVEERCLLVSTAYLQMDDTEQVLVCAQDITERKRAEETLRESEERYRLIAENTADTISVFDLNLKPIYVSPSVLKLRGYMVEEAMTQSLDQVLTPESLQKAKKVFTEQLALEASGKADPARAALLELEEYRKDGSTIWVELAVSALRDKDLQPTGILTVSRDITERKQAEEAVRQSEERFRALYEDNPSMYFTVDEEGTVLSVNQFGAKQLGYTVAELVGQSVLDVFYENDKEAVKQQLTTCIQNPKELFHWEFRKVRKDGNIMWVKEAVRAVRRVDGSLVVFIVCEDISERKQAETELRESEERHRTLFEHAGFAISLYDAETRKRVEFNTMAYESLGYTREEFQELTAVDITVNNDSEKNREHFKRIIKNGPDLYETQLVAKNGEIRDVLISAVPIRMYEKDFIQMIRVDITDQKRADEKLKASFERLRRSLESTVSALASALEMRDPYTAGHQQRATDLACAIAEEMNLAEEQVDGIRLAGLIHDIGKINIPAEILNKPGQLTEIEYSLFKNHPQVGYDVLKTVDFPWPVAQIVLQHHERMDGSGYPQGLSGEEIMLEARILAVSDIVEAIASHRPYRPARGTGDALEEILRNKGTLYDPEVVDACLRVFYEKGFTFERFLQVAKSVKIH